MKTIILIISLLLVALDLSLPDNIFKKSKKQQTITCGIGYSEEEEAIVYTDSVARCNLIEITDLPPAAEGTVPFKSRFTKGSYLLKRKANLGTEIGFEFILEDQLTGSTYNLKSETPYSFNVSRTIPDRFVLHVKKLGNMTSK